MAQIKVNAGQPHPVDLHVGSRIVHRRKELELTQSDLAQTLGVTYQQSQKYEKGLNRISASKLWIVAAALSVDIEYFFEGLDVPGETVRADVVPDAFQTELSRAIGVGARALSCKKQKLIAELFESLVRNTEPAASGGLKGPQARPGTKAVASI